MLRYLSWTLTLLPAIGCGSDHHHGQVTGAPSSVENVLPVVVDHGPDDIGYTNGLFASVTVCVPGTSQCQTIDHLLVDTGSVGVRILGSGLSLSLPAWQNAGLPLAQCGQFVSGFTWGPLRQADLRLAGKRADSIPIQVIEATTYPVPSSCTGADQNTTETLGAKGVLGVGSFVEDCGAACERPIGMDSVNPGVYYACTSAATDGCSQTAVPAGAQMVNPVAAFAGDNNGVVVELPSIPEDGAPSVPGSLTFGIGTQSNNALGATNVLTLDEAGNFTTNYPAGGAAYQSFFDTGSNGIYFLDSNLTGIPLCPGSASGYYCPPTRLDLSAEHVGVNRVTTRVSFRVANAEVLFANTSRFAFDDLAGPNDLAPWFDWGLPFFFGKTIFVAIENQPTPAGLGPFVAY